MGMPSGLLVATLWVAVVSGASPPPATGGERPGGISKRVPWTTSTIRGSPDPPAPYRTERVFAKLRFSEPLALTPAPGTDRLLVAERHGKIFSFRDDPVAAEAELFVDLGPGKREIYGLALPADFPRRRDVYISSCLDPAANLPRGTRVSRFRAGADDLFRCDPDSETVILEWPTGGHLGGCIKFGPDGYLYVATGDASEIADRRQTGQDISDLPGSILRIDVDRAEGGRPYGIPADNPFVGIEGARPEVWAYGLRQVWKMSFDRVTGDLWGGNVGQDLWEMVHRFTRGGNYGWSVTEGSHPFRPERPRGPTPILPPVVEHDHTVARSVTGGFVYRGARLRELAGTYIYGDYDTGRIWALRLDGDRVTWHQELVDTNLRLVAFGEDRRGELYLLDHMGGGIHRLVPSGTGATDSVFPRKLSETGLFASVPELRPAPGLIPYSVVAPVWSDGAHKERYLALPGNSRIEFDAIEYPQPAPGAPHGWKFPDGTVLVETLSLEMDAGKPESRRRLETRILHHERLVGTEDVGDQYWQGYTYVWNDEQTEAILLEEPGGRDRTFTLRDAAAPGGRRRQTWHFPGRTECTLCHNMAAKFALGVNTLQMNRDHDYGGVVENQLRVLERLGVFTEPLPAPPEKLPRLVDYSDRREDLDRRARSYLHANCSHCHRKWGGGNADFLLLYPLSLEETGIIDVRPGQGSFQIPDARVVASGDPSRSVLLYRMASIGSGRMPRAGSSVVDERGLDVIHDWIARLPATPEGEEKESVRHSRVEIAAALARLRERDAPEETRRRALDQLLSSTPGALRLLRAVDDGSLPEVHRGAAIARATASTAPEVRDLFERHLPEEERTRRLGSAIRPEEILELAGDAARGRRIFREATGVQCRNCHRLEEEGVELGPDLAGVSKKYDRARLLETILEPSREIDPKYLTYLAQTRRGEVHVGLLVERTATEVLLRDASNRTIRLAAGELELMVPQRQSLMPELLLRDMTARDVADLVEYLMSLK